MGALTPWLVNGGVAAAVLVLLVYGLLKGYVFFKPAMDAKDREIADLKQALSNQNERANITTQVALEITQAILRGLPGGGNDPH